MYDKFVGNYNTPRYIAKDNFLKINTLQVVTITYYYFDENHKGEPGGITTFFALSNTI